MLREGLLQKTLGVLISVIVFIYAFEGIWGAGYSWPYTFTGVVAGALVVFCVLYGRLYRHYDTFLWAVFFSLAWISTIICLGVSLEFFTSEFLFVWLLFVAFYFVVQIVPDPERFLGRIFGVFAVSMGLVLLYILAKATWSLRKDIPSQDRVRGCFHAGRLCAMYNANALAFACTALIVVSVFSFLYTKNRIRILYAMTGLLGWFCMGLTGCRTGMIGVSLSLGIIVFSALYTGNFPLKISNRILHIVTSIIIAFLTFLVILESFMLPVYMYQLIMSTIAKLIGHNNLLEHVSELVVRRISDDDGTLSDRTLIWPASLKQIGRTVRRFLIGVSPLAKEKIAGVYEGHHDLLANHAHNTYIDILRKHGLFGFVTLMTMAVMWGIMGFKTLFDAKVSMAIRYLMAGVAGILIMGFVEAVPFAYTARCYTAIPLFLACGYCYRTRSEV